jgi:hypothetical protein
MTEISGKVPPIVRPEGEASAPVDLVIYIDGGRVVIGKAGVLASGDVVAKLNDNLPDRVKKILSQVNGEFAFGIPRMNARNMFTDLSDS